MFLGRCGLFASVLLAGLGQARPAIAADTVILVDPSAAARTTTASSQTERVATLQQALERVRALRRGDGRRGSLHIALVPGVHRLTTAAEITIDHSGSREAPLVIRPTDGAEPGSVRILGSQRIAPLSGPATGQRAARAKTLLSTDAHQHVRRYSLPAAARAATSIDVSRPRDGVPAVPFEVFDAQGPLRPARWPNMGWSRTVSANDDAARPSFTLAPEKVKAWQDEPDLWAGGYWQYDWRYETQRIEHLDAQRAQLFLAGRPFDGVRAGARVFVYHALAELDEPGEWYRDRASGELLVWPRVAETADQGLEVSLLETAFLVKGAEHVRFRGLSIEMTRGDAIMVKGGGHIVVEESSIRWTGGRAAAFDDTTASGIVQSRVVGTGAGGVLLYGGNRRELTPSGLFSLDTRYERFARLSLTYAAAIELGGVGQTVAGNFITDADHLGILFQGNDHLIERNELSRLMLDSADGGAIYTGRDWTSRGTRIRHNFLHDIRPAAGLETKGVYLDDMASGITIEGNIFLRVDQAVFIGGGRDNNVTDNIFVATMPAVHIDSRGLNDHKAQIENAESEMQVRLREIPYQSPLWRSRYPALPSILQDEPGAAKRNILINNIYFTEAPYHILADVDRSKQTLSPNIGLKELSHSLLTRAIVAKRARDLSAILGAVPAAAAIRQIPVDALDRDERLTEPRPR